MTERRGLGRGLSALIPPEERSDGRLRELPVERVDPNPRQPRETFDEGALTELAASIREVGILQPLIARPLDGGRYELIAGERRLRAARLAGLARVPAIVRDASDVEILREALIENIHRAELNPLEEAAAYAQLLDDFDVTHEELARRLGRSRPAVTNALRLLGLPPAVQRRVAAGVLSAGHAKALLGLGSAAEQERLAESIVAEGLSVRATEERVRVRQAQATGGTTPVRAHERRREQRPPGLDALEARLADALGAEVRVTVGARGGRLTIAFGSVDELERIVGVVAEGLQRPIPVAEEPLDPRGRRG